MKQNENTYLTDEHKIFKKAIADFVEKEAPREKVREWDKHEIFPLQMYKKMARQGWIGMDLPEEVGGLGADIFYPIILSEEISKYSFELGVGWSHIEFGIHNLLKYGTEKQKELVPKALAGEVRFSISITEPNAGSDAASLRLSAKEDGDYYIINGEKTFSSLAHIEGNWINLSTRTANTEDKRKGITMFLIPNTLEGIEFIKLTTLARRIGGTNQIIFHDVRVPKEMMLGELNKGWEILTSHLNIERLHVAAGSVGMAQQAVDDAINYANQRVQFGKSISQFQSIKHMLVDMQVLVDAARELTYRAAWLYGQGKPCEREVSEAKLFATEALKKVTTNGMQILGGYAQLSEFDMERYWRQSSLLTVGGGSSQIQRSIIAKHLDIGRRKG